MDDTEGRETRPGRRGEGRGNRVTTNPLLGRLERLEPRPREHGLVGADGNINAERASNRGGNPPSEEADPMELLMRQREELARQQEELDRRLREEDMLRQRQEELMRREEELDRRLKEEETFKLRKEEELRQRQEEEELMSREEELNRRLKEEEAFKLRREEKLRKRQEEELRQRQEEEELMRREEELNRRLREEETLKMRREEEKLRKRQEEEVFKLRQEEELRKRQEELDRRRRKEEEKIRQRQEERRRKKEEQAEMELLRRQQEELKRRQEALLSEEREMDRRLREKEDALKRMQMHGPPPPASEGTEASIGISEEFPRYSSNYSSDYTPDRVATSPRLRRKGSSMQSSGDASEQYFVPRTYSSDYSSDHSSEKKPPSSPGLRQKMMDTLKRWSPKKRNSGDDYASDFESQTNASPSPLGLRDEKYSKARPRAPASANIMTYCNSDRRNRAKVILRKIVHAIVTDLDDETLMRDDTEPVLIAITLLKEAMVGLLIAFAVVSLVLFIDHRFMMGLPTARNFRRATFHLLDDKETLKNFEENAGLKFLDMEEYAAMKEEVAKSGNRTSLAVSILKQRSMDLENTERDMVTQVHEVSKIIKRLGMHQYCEMCLWNKGKGSTCKIQVKAMEAKYQTSKFDEIFKSMKKQSCEKLEDKLVKNWDKMNDFCAECEFEPDQRCSSRADYLSKKYDVTLVRAKARLMLKTYRCRKSHQEEESKRLKHFCGDCLWDETRTCQQRAGYLMYKGKYSSRAALLSAMKNAACVKK